MQISRFLFHSNFYHMPINRGDFALKDDFRKKSKKMTKIFTICRRKKNAI